MMEFDEVILAQQQIFRLQALLEASRRIHATTDLDEVLEMTLQIVVQELELTYAYYTAFPQTYGRLPAEAADLALSPQAMRFSLYDKSGVLFTELVLLSEDARTLALDEIDFIEGLTLQAAVAIENARFHERTILLAQIREEREKARQLLLNILPAKVAEDLQEGRNVPTVIEEATIGFTDFVGFTLSTERMPAERLVEELHTYFSAFDEVATRYGIEKLKTIGDSYMFASGLPEPQPGNAVIAILAAMELLEQVRLLALRQGAPGWAVRIGLHTGPVIAGVVGLRKFAFDIWGNAVNFASRMESSGSPGRINVSEAVHELVCDFFVCEKRGKVTTKDNRDVDMFFVSGITPALIADGTHDAFHRQFRRRFHVDLPAFPAFVLNLPVT